MKQNFTVSDNKDVDYLKKFDRKCIPGYTGFRPCTKADLMVGRTFGKVNKNIPKAYIQQRRWMI